MARVPILERRITPTARTGSAVQPEMEAFRAKQQSVSQFVEGAGRVASAAAKGMDERAKAEENRARTTALMGAMNELGDAERKLRYDKDNGLVAARGEHAISRQSEFEERYQKYIDEISGKLGDRRVREEFRRQAGGKQSAFKDDLHRHVAKEHEHHRKTTFESFMVGTAGEAADYFADAAETGEATPMRHGEITLQASRDVVAAISKQDGLNEDETAALMKQEMSKTHATVVGHLLSKEHVADAKKYFHRNKGEMTTAVQDALRKRIFEGAKTSRIRDLTASIWKDSFNEQTEQYDLKKAYAELEKRGIKEADVYNGVRDGLTGNMRRTVEADRLNDVNPKGRLMHNLYYATGRVDRSSSDYTSLSPRGQADIDKMEQMWNDHKDAQQRARRSAVDDGQKHLISLFNAMQPVKGEHGNTQATVDLTSGPFVGLTPTTRNILKKNQIYLNNNLDKLSGYSFSEYETTYRSVLSDLGYDDFSSSETERLEGYLALKFIHFKNERGNQDATPDRKEIGKWLTALVTNRVTVPGILWDSDMPEIEAIAYGERDWVPKGPPPPKKIAWEEPDGTKRKADDTPAARRHIKETGSKQIHPETGEPLRTIEEDFEPVGMQ